MKEEDQKSNLESGIGDSSIDDNSSSKVFVKSEAEKKFVRKLNRTTLPLIFFIMFVQFCDKSVLSIAAVLGIKEDTNISLTQYSWLGSIFYLGYLICQVPNNFLIQKFRPKNYLGVSLILWGITVGTTAACSNFSELAACRFLLGLFEGVSYPCVYIALNTLYRRSEQSLVWGFLGVGNGGGTVIAVLIAYGFSHMDGLNGWKAWRWGYIICGIMTVIVGICTLLFMIDHPHHPLLKLTEEEKLIVEERTKDNCVVRVKKVKYYQFWEALKEPRFYLIFIICSFNSLQNGGIIAYSTLLVQSLGFNSMMTIILQIPNGLAAAVFALGSVLIAHRIKNVSFVGLATSLIGCLGFIILLVIPGKAKLAGFYLTWAMVGTNALTQTLVTTNVSGYTKKVLYNNLVMVANTVGNLCGPFMMVESQAPKYIGGMVGYIITNLVSFTGIGILYLIMRRKNNRRKLNLPDQPTDVHLDLTDVQDKNFMYKL